MILTGGKDNISKIIFFKQFFPIRSIKYKIGTFNKSFNWPGLVFLSVFRNVHTLTAYKCETHYHNRLKNVFCKTSDFCYKNSTNVCERTLKTIKLFSTLCMKSVPWLFQNNEKHYLHHQVLQYTFMN